MTDKKKLNTQLQKYRNRLDKISDIYRKKGYSEGNKALVEWKSELSKILSTSNPKYNQELEEIFSIGSSIKASNYEHPVRKYWRAYGKNLQEFMHKIASKIKEENFIHMAEDQDNATSPQENNNKIFIVHGHDNGLRDKVARQLEKLRLEPIILMERANLGNTIIEKFESFSDEVKIGIILYTKDDKIAKHNDSSGSSECVYRGRQNVVFEHGYLLAKLDRKNIIVLTEEGVELPGDIGGTVYIATTDWALCLAKEIKSMGMDIDLNLIG